VIKPPVQSVPPSPEAEDNDAIHVASRIVCSASPVGKSMEEVCSASPVGKSMEVVCSASSPVQSVPSSPVGENYPLSGARAKRKLLEEQGSASSPKKLKLNCNSEIDGELPSLTPSSPPAKSSNDVQESSPSSVDHIQLGCPVLAVQGTCTILPVFIFHSIYICICVVVMHTSNNRYHKYCRA